MKKWLIIVAAMMLAACSSESNRGKVYYQLPVNAQPVAQTVSRSDSRLLWIDQITLADYLSSNGVVYQTSDVQYVIAANNLWASPLDQQLRNTLMVNLGQAMPGWIVTSQPLNNEENVLTVTITGFHGRYDGKVIVSGEWLLKQKEKLISRPFRIELNQPEDGYDALVRSLAAAWQQEAQDIASVIQQNQ